MAGFHPQRLTTSCSLNQVVVGERKAVDLLSVKALAELMGREGLAPGEAPSWRLRELLEAGDGRARAVVAEFGRRLGDLLLTLKHPETPGRQGSDAVRRAYLDHWLTIGRVWLAGGLVSAPMGAHMVTAARHVLGEALAVEVARHPTELPLVGAAMAAGVGDGDVVTLDFGHTAVKRGVAHFAGGVLEELRVLRSMETAGRLVPSSPEAVGAAIAAIAAETFREAREAGFQPSPRSVMSIASYYGRPETRGLYANLGTLPAGWLSAAVSSATGLATDIDLIHDGTAAASALAGERDAAVVTMGTSLGVGFAPAERGSHGAPAHG